MLQNFLFSLRIVSLLFMPALNSISAYELKHVYTYVLQK